MIELDNPHVAAYANRRNLPEADARMLDGIEWRGNTFSSEAEVHSVYETVRFLCAPDEIREVPSPSLNYESTD